MYEKLEIPTDKFYPHQKEYYDALCKMKEKKENFHSIVCIPTGGGKTRLAITYAINKELNEGKRILWIAHSHYLLEQAYDAFYLLSSKKLSWENMLLAYYLEDGDLSIDYRNKQVRHVGRLDSVNCEKYDVIVTSFQSLSNYMKNHENRGKRDPLEKLLGSNICVIVDEVHHLGAPTYYNLLRDYAHNKTLIGLSATPVRKDDGDYQLEKIFFDDLGVTVSMKDLIDRGYLIKPILENISLPYGGENGFRWEAEYDQEVYQRYVGNQDRYGKTVIFAQSIQHAETLYDLFSANDNLKRRVFLIHSYLEDRFQQFFEFKDSKDGILINVNIMNEGVDIPDIKTVFLTKPIESPIIVTQCIGRALRTCKGKKVAYVVNFAVSEIEDKWYLTSPTFTYGLYDISYKWNANYQRELIQFVEQQVLNDLRNGIDGIEQNARFSIDDVLSLAGYYNLKFGTHEFSLLVTCSEYKAIENYRKTLNINLLPNKFLYDQRDGFKEVIQEAIKDNNCKFVNCDNELRENFTILSELILLLFANYLGDYSGDYSLRNLDEKIQEVFVVFKKTKLLWALQSIDIGTEEKFTLLVWNQCVNLKYRLNLDLSWVQLGYTVKDDFFIDIDIVKVFKQDIFEYGEKIQNEFLKRQSSKSTDEILCWNDILDGDYTKEIYQQMISTIAPNLNYCINIEVKEQLKKSLQEVGNKIIVQIAKCIKNSSENEIQGIIGDIFDKEIISSCCRDYNAKMIAETLQKYYDSGWLLYLGSGYLIGIIKIKIWRKMMNGELRSRKR